MDQTAADLQNAEQWAQEDIRISQQAAAELRQAERAMESGGSFYLQGFSADMSRASSLLDEARRQFLSQAYEQAIQLADQAELAARQAVAEAERRAEERKRRRELEQRRRAAAMILTSTMRTGSRGGGISIGGFGSSSSSHSSHSSSSSSQLLVERLQPAELVRGKPDAAGLLSRTRLHARSVRPLRWQIFRRRTGFRPVTTVPKRVFRVAAGPHVP